MPSFSFIRAPHPAPLSSHCNTSALGELWYKQLPGTEKPIKHDAGWLFVANKSHSGAAFVFFTANKWKCTVTFVFLGAKNWKCNGAFVSLLAKKWKCNVTFGLFTAKKWKCNGVWDSFQSKKWKCIAVCRSFPSINGNAARLVVLSYPKNGKVTRFSLIRQYKVKLRFFLRESSRS